jgi:alpha-soluble NSF attachment protein
MSDNPEELLKKAKKKLNPGFFGKMFNSKESLLEDALGYFQSAANGFKIEKNWQKAGECYEECAKIEIELESDTAMNQYKDAAHCFSFCDVQRSQQNLDNCIKFCVKKGRYQQAGKLTQEIAHNKEVEFNYPEAIKKYKEAAEYYKLDSQNTKSLEQNCLLKVADLMCISGDKNMFENAPQLYEKLAMEYLTIPLLKSSAKDLFFKAVVCYIAKKDEVTADIKLKQFLSEDPTFDDTREAKLLENLIKYISDPPDPENYKKEVQSFKKYRDLDKWKLNMFAMGLKKIEMEDEDNLL